MSKENKFNFGFETSGRKPFGYTIQAKEYNGKNHSDNSENGPLYVKIELEYFTYVKELLISELEKLITNIQNEEGVG